MLQPMNYESRELIQVRWCENPRNEPVRLVHSPWHHLYHRRSTLIPAQARAVESMATALHHHD
jgi:hypothetical protein